MIPLLSSGGSFAQRSLRKGRRILFGEAGYDRQYLIQRYLDFTGRSPNLDEPKGFLEKLLWLSLHYRNPQIPSFVDKWQTRQQVTKRVGPEVLNELLGVWDRPQQVPFADLPDRFVLKATAGSGWNILCPDKSKLDISESIQKLTAWQNRNYYHWQREWQYRSLRSRIIAERFMFDPLHPHRSVPDFKIFCFNGQPRVIGVNTDRWGDNRHDFFDVDWNAVDYGMSTKPRSNPPLQKPENLAQMVEIAAKLADGFPFVRVDLYRHAEKIIFGEMTFSPSAGNMPIQQPEADNLWGSWITLPTQNIKR